MSASRGTTLTVTLSRPSAISVLAHLEDGVDLDGDVAGEDVDADGGARVAPGIAEHLDDEGRGAGHPLRLLREIVDRVGEAAQAHATPDAVEIAAARTLRHGEVVEAATQHRLP